MRVFLLDVNGAAAESVCAAVDFWRDVISVVGKTNAFDVGVQTNVAMETAIASMVY